MVFWLSSIHPPPYSSPISLGEFSLLHCSDSRWKMIQAWHPVTGVQGTDALSLGPVTSAQPQEPSLLSLATHLPHCWKWKSPTPGSGLSRGCGFVPSFAMSSHVSFDMSLNLSKAPFFHVEKGTNVSYDFEKLTQHILYELICIWFKVRQGNTLLFRDTYMVAKLNQK